jgi:hypothetical protein
LTDSLSQPSFGFLGICSVPLFFAKRSLKISFIKKKLPAHDPAMLINELVLRNKLDLHVNSLFVHRPSKRAKLKDITLLEAYELRAVCLNGHAALSQDASANVPLGAMFTKCSPRLLAVEPICAFAGILAPNKPVDRFGI